MTHAALTPVVYDRRLVKKIAPTLVEKSKWTYLNNQGHAAFEIGIETGSVRLVEKYTGGRHCRIRLNSGQILWFKPLEYLTTTRYIL